MAPKKAVSKPGAGDSLSRDLQAVYDRCLAAGVAVSQSDIQSFLPAGKNDVVAASHAINRLLSRRLLDAMHQGSELVYRAISQNEARRMAGMDGDEAMIYQHIKDSGNQGIWSNIIKTRTNLHQKVVMRVLKSLENKSFIKCVTNIQNPTRKIYMLYDLTPSAQVSGGPWFTDSELDVEFVERLSDAIAKYIRSKSRPKGEDLESIYPPSHSEYPSAQEIHDWLSKKGLTDVELGLSDITALLDVLVYDGKIERHRDGLSYRSVASMIESDHANAYAAMPCGQCPVFNLCQEGGVVSPQGCEYWHDWLNSNL